MAKSWIEILVTADTKAAQKGLDGVGDKLSKTDNAFGTVAKGGAAAGAALLAVGVASVGAFQGLALSVDKLANATGLSHEQASRLIEVGDDIGVSSETLAKGIGKMEKTLGGNADAFAKYGLEVARTKDGQVDSNETFLRAIDLLHKIEDPTKRAAAGSAIFGKGWAEMAELVDQGGDKVRQGLAAVSDARIINEEEVNKARDLRAAFDEIMDAGQDLLLTIGQALAPALTKLAPVIASLIEKAAPLAEAIGELLVAAIESLAPILEGLMPIIQGVTKALGGLAEVVSAFKPTGFTKEIGVAGDALQAVKDKADAAGWSAADFEAAMIQAGTQITPTGDLLTDLSAAAELVSEKIDKAAVSHEHTGLAAQDLSAKTQALTRDTEGVGLAMQDAQLPAQRLRERTEGLASAEQQAADNARRAAQETANLRAEWDLLFGTLDQQQAVIDIGTQFDSLNTAAAEAWEAAKSGADDAAAKNVAYQSELIATKRRVAEYAQELGGLPPSVTSEILAQIDNGSISSAEQALNAVARARQVIYNAQVAGHREYAEGTSFHPGGPATINEKWSPTGAGEVVQLPMGARVFDSSRSSRMQKTEGMTFQTVIQGSVYGVDHLQEILDNRDRRLAQQIRMGAR